VIFCFLTGSIRTSLFLCPCYEIEAYTGLKYKAFWGRFWQIKGYGDTGVSAPVHRNGTCEPFYEDYVHLYYRCHLRQNDRALFRLLRRPDSICHYDKQRMGTGRKQIPEKLVRTWFSSWFLDIRLVFLLPLLFNKNNN